MKKVLVKRLLYINAYGDQLIGAQEYSGWISNQYIYDSIHEIGKTEWIGENLWIMKNGYPIYRIEIGNFYIEKPSFIDRLIRRN